VRIKAAIGLGLAIVGVGVIVTLSLSAPRLAGSNSEVELSGLAVFVPGHGRRCQYGERVPAGTRELRLFGAALAPPDGPVVATIARSGRAGVPPRVVARGTVPFGFRGPSVRTPLHPAVRDDVLDAQLCLYNRGRQTVSFAGNLTPILGSGANPNSAQLADDARVDYMRGGAESWWGVLPTIADRFGLMKASFFGSWTMWAVFAALAGLWAATIAVLVRNLGRG
jgi:hypothetical protein